MAGREVKGGETRPQSDGGCLDFCVARWRVERCSVQINKTMGQMTDLGGVEVRESESRTRSGVSLVMRERCLEGWLQALWQWVKRKLGVNKAMVKCLVALFIQL